MDCPSTGIFGDNGSFLQEIWAWFGIGTIVLAARMALRLYILSWRRLQGDDYMVLPVWICFLCDSITVTMIYNYGTNLGLADDEIEHFSDCQLHHLKLGSQMQLLAWYTYTLLIWSLKGMMLFFLYRLTHGLTQQRLVKLFALISAISYLPVFLTISCGCIPIQRNWQIKPTPPKHCTMKLQNFYVTTTFNVLTDAIILSVPVPLLWTMRISVRKKIGLTLLLCTGIFVITAAVLRIAFTLTSFDALNINKWGTRETAVGIIVVNIPILRPIFRRKFWQRTPGTMQNTTPNLRNCNSSLRHTSTIGTSSRFKRHRRNTTLREIMGMSRSNRHGSPSEHPENEPGTDSQAEREKAQVSNVTTTGTASTLVGSLAEFETPNTARVYPSIAAVLPLPTAVVLASQVRLDEGCDMEQQQEEARLSPS